MVGRAVRLVSLAVLCVLATTTVRSQSVTIEGRDAEVWLQQQMVRGAVSGAGADAQGTVFVGSRTYPFEVEGMDFTADVELGEGLNLIVACVEGSCSDTLRWTLGYDLEPEVYAFAEVDGSTVTLHGRVLEQPTGAVTTFAWQADPENPASVTLDVLTDSTARFVLPPDAPLGEYYFDLLATDESGRQGTARTFVTVSEHGVEAFDIWTDHAAWVDRAIVYEVTPYIFEGNGGWRDVTARLGEIAELGVNTLWIQPVFETHGGGQGYDVTNYFALRKDLGTEEDLRDLVETAQEVYGMRVLFDFVPNHTSIEHPYARDVIQHGEASHYFDYYLTEPDNAPYSQHYRTGMEPFIYYFWDDLVILDWDEPEVYRWMMEAGRTWIDRFDIDGYRIDAVWGLNARTPEAMQQWRFDLKRRKPEIFLLGEDKATWPSSFERRFDAAYDWYPEEDWVSHWTWQVTYSATQNHTIFNTPPASERSERLRDALTNHGNGWHPDAKVFRFLQNNDTFPFIESHGLERTKMAGALLFTLPGIPMIYNGQEIGHDRHPYSTWQIFRPGESIRSQDPYGLYEHYRDLTALRSTFPVLYSDTYAELAVTPDRIEGSTFAFRRWHEGRHALVIVNMDEEGVRARLTLPLEEMGLEEGTTYYLTDLMTGEARPLSGPGLRFPVESVSGYTTRMFILDEEAVQVPTGIPDVPEELPHRLALDQNYPNPFNPSTYVTFEVPRADHVMLRLYDVLGREVTTLVDGTVQAGRHTVHVDGTGLASGVYVYRLESGGRAVVRRMILAK